MVDNTGVSNNCTIEKDKLERIVSDTLKYRPVVIVGKQGTGKTELCKLIAEEIGNVLYIDATSKAMYNRYLGNVIDSNFELFVEICNTKYNAIIIDGVGELQSEDSLIALVENKEIGLVCTVCDLGQLVNFGLDLGEFTIVTTDYSNSRYTYTVN